jgi:hypothetical protein
MVRPGVEFIALIAAFKVGRCHVVLIDPGMGATRLPLPDLCRARKALVAILCAALRILSFGRFPGHSST